MNAVADRAGLRVSYVFEGNWVDIIGLLKRGTADLAPGMGVSGDRERELLFSTPIDAFPISFFVRAEHSGIDGSPGVHAVGGVRGSVALEKLRDRAGLRLQPYESYQQGLFDLLAGKIEAFACPSPTLWQLAREARVDDRIKVVDKPVAEITRAIAVREDNSALLERLNAAIKGYLATDAYRAVYAKWYGRPVPYWTPSRIALVAAGLLLLVVVLMAAWRHVSVLRLNRELTETILRRRATEAALQRSIGDLDTFFDVSADLLCIADTDGRFRHLNRAWERTLGFSREELLAGRFLDFVHPDDVGRTRDAIAALSSQQQVLGFVNRYRCKDGTHRWLEWRSVPEGGLIYAAARDITEQRRAADALQLNHERLESLLRISQSRTGTQELLDQALEEAVRITRSSIGYVYFYDEDREEFTLNTWSREVMKECAVTAPQTVYQLEKTGIWGEAVRQRKPIVVQDLRAPNPLKKGLPPGHAPLHSFMTVPVFHQERIVAVVGVANKPTAYEQEDVNQLTLLMDAVWRIVEHQRIEAALEAGERKYRTIYDSAIDAIFIVRMDGTFIDVNSVSHERLGYTREEMLAMHLSELDTAEFSEQVGARIGLLQQQGHLTFESAHRRKDGSVMPVEINSRIVGYDGGKVLVSVVRDITERKLAEREREKLIADLQKALAEIKTLQGILPICSSCKKIRDDTGAWHQMEVYIRDRTNAEFSHGLCADCAKRLYPDIMKKLS